MVPSPGNLENYRHLWDPSVFPAGGNTVIVILLWRCRIYMYMIYLYIHMYPVCILPVSFASTWFLFNIWDKVSQLLDFTVMMKVIIRLGLLFPYKYKQMTCAVWTHTGWCAEEQQCCSEYLVGLLCKFTKFTDAKWAACNRLTHH